MSPSGVKYHHNTTPLQTLTKFLFFRHISINRTNESNKYYMENQRYILRNKKTERSWEDRNTPQVACEARKVEFDIFLHSPTY